jgi:hypothetical protein
MNDNLSFRDPHERIGSRLMAPKHLCLFSKIQNYLVISPAQGRERNAMPRPCEGAMQMTMEDMAHTRPMRLKNIPKRVGIHERDLIHANNAT